jgi:hypothetical protein
MKSFAVTDKQTIIEVSTGKVIYFGLDDFKEKIVDGDACFICGAMPGEKEFNNEHIIPNWILRKHQLHNKEIHVTDKRSVKYSSYTVPCCKECNEDLGRLLEKPVNELLKNPYREVARAIKKNPDIFKLLYRWMSLLFIKTHLKDTYYLEQLDRRKHAGYLGDSYDWNNIHHIHCMSRMHFTDAIIDPEVYGSILVLPVLNNSADKFDYNDHMLGKTSMIILDDICIMAILDDAGMVANMIRETLQKINGPLTPYQVKEIFSHLIFGNIHLEPRPVFSSTITVDGKYVIEVKIPETFQLTQQKIISPGELLHFYAEKFIPDDLPERNQVLEDIKLGKRAYLFNEKGEFIQHEIP